MHIKGELLLIFKGIICIATFFNLITISLGGESEIVSFFKFIHAIDPENVLQNNWNIGLVRNPCSKHWKGIVCNLEGTRIVTINLENLELNGKIDGKSLCNLRDLQFLSLARNRIKGEIPNSILNCTSLRYLNLSNNLLNGKVPIGLSKLKNLKRLDISNNYFHGIFRLSKQEILVAPENDSIGPRAAQDDRTDVKMNSSFPKWETWVPFTIGIVFVMLLVIIVNLRSWRLAKEKAAMNSLEKSSIVISQEKEIDEVKCDEIKSNLVFFVGESERFRMEDLLEAEADLRNQGFSSSLYKVKIKNNPVLAVKRLKKLKVTIEEFEETMTWIGNLNHPNILPLVGFNCTNEEKFLMCRYQTNGSLLTLQEDHSQGKRRFPFKLRLSIAVGIARGLNFIYESQRDKTEEETMPHGNIKPSNVLLNENDEPLVSEYGYSKFLDPENFSRFNYNGYTPPEKCLSQGADVYSLGVILLELLTGKMVEKSGLDLPKWVKSMMREEWTGEVFDKEIRRFEMFSFSLLNISLKCVAHFPENRPRIEDVLVKIEEVVSAYQDYSPSPSSSIEFPN